ncbi:hypothetical protein PVBG_03742 [Plasmodium vivax Brazil I]|uniref:Uncharacterized protein n=1 Tax=Plasmodium vivax (strain Brazil I) TaxID=1033975 RepID=A0A0J9SXW5_PLAV1|nr:hypothetical protein PVBG_03742 [Plasmodium vivax Brazil I]
MQSGTGEEGTPVEDAGEDVPSSRSKDHNDCSAQQAGDSPKRSDLTEIKKMSKPVNGFAASIAMEALAKASTFISKNERVHKEYSGVGLNNAEDNRDSRERLDVNGHAAHTVMFSLHGAHSIMAGTDKELQEKLKNRWCNA